MTARRPPLFDVLASRCVEPQGAARASEASVRALRESVRHELGLLLNSTALALGEPVGHLAHVARSTLSYGMPDLAGRAASSLDQRWLAAQLTQAIRLFEPRLQPDSIQVRPRAHRAVSHNVVSFEIDATLRHALGAETIELDSELDLESGGARVLERQRPRRPKQAAHVPSTPERG